MCPECENTKGYIIETCGSCAGTGEGANEIVSCYFCKGKGIVWIECPCNEDNENEE